MGPKQQEHEMCTPPPNQKYHKKVVWTSQVSLTHTISNVRCAALAAARKEGLVWSRKTIPLRLFSTTNRSNNSAFSEFDVHDLPPIGDEHGVTVAPLGHSLQNGPVHHTGSLRDAPA